MKEKFLGYLNNFNIITPSSQTGPKGNYSDLNLERQVALKNNNNNNKNPKAGVGGSLLWAWLRFTQCLYNII